MQESDSASNATVSSLLRDRAQASSERTFIQMVDGDACTYGETYAAVTRLAQGLRDLGVGSGQTVVIMLRNSVEAIHAWFAVNLAGGIEVSINTGYRGVPLEHAINQARASIMIVGAEFLPVMRASIANLPHLRTLIVVGEDTGDIGSSRMRCMRYEDLATAAGNADFPEVRYSDIASVIYTSGTTGPAKGVMMPHAQVVLLARQTARNCGFSEGDTYYCFHPMYHMAGKFMGVLATLVAGARIVLDSSFAPEHWLRRIRDYEVTISGAHGPMLEMIFALPPTADDRSHKLRTICSAPFPRHIARDFERRFGVRGLEVWGMTEVGIPCWNALDQPLREGSCGKVDEEHFEFRIVDPETDEALPRGCVGEFVVRSKLPWTLMQAYMGMPDKTLEAWRNLWFHTGDAGYMDDEGYVYFVDRASERIRRRAENISSYDIEVAALRHPAVREAAAVGVPSGFAADDDIKLCVACRDGMQVAPDELLTHLAALLPHYMVPRYIEFVDALPRSATNKLRRAALKEAPYGSDVWDRKAHGVVLRDIMRQA